MKIHTCEQASLEWLHLRAGKVTCSCLDQILTPQFAVRKGQMPVTYRNLLLAERWRGTPEPQPEGVWNLEQGNLLESYGKPAFTLETGLEIQSVGFCETDAEDFGCSPDSLVGEDAGLELKCPHLKTHIAYLLDGELPEQYRCQVYGSMAVTGRSKWYFSSFRRDLPPLILEIHRDPKIDAAILAGVAEFNERLDEAFEKLCKHNGGPPPKRAPFVPSSADRPKFSWEQRSEMPS